jgi:aminoglycoside phosphotransferase (APT) family kinase protein
VRDDPWTAARLGPDLRDLIRSRGCALTGVEVLSGSRRVARATFRLTFADGAVLKARVCEDRAQAERIEQLVAYLDPLHFPRVRGRHGCALFEEWIAGRALDPPLDRDVFAAGGVVLAGVHSTVLPGALRDRALGYVETSGARLREGLDRLVALRALAGADAAAARALAESRPPRRFAPALVHGDFCGEHMVVDGHGRMHVVDNETVLVHAPEYDLARTRYRWPMSAPERAAYERGYGDSSAAEGFRAHGDFWTVVVLVESALFRLRTGRGAAEIPLALLRARLDEGT